MKESILSVSNSFLTLTNLSISLDKHMHSMSKFSGGYSGEPPAPWLFAVAGREHSKRYWYSTYQRNYYLLALLKVWNHREAVCYGSREALITISTLSTTLQLHSFSNLYSFVLQSPLLHKPLIDDYSTVSCVGYCIQYIDL